MHGVNYRILMADEPENLEREVDEYILAGWVPVGGHVVVHIPKQLNMRDEVYMVSQSVYKPIVQDEKE